MKYWLIETKITMLVANRQEEWCVNCQEISSNERLISANKMYGSARDVTSIYTDCKLTYTELTDGFL